MASDSLSQTAERLGRAAGHLQRMLRALTQRAGRRRHLPALLGAAAGVGFVLAWTLPARSK